MYATGNMAWPGVGFSADGGGTGRHWGALCYSATSSHMPSFSSSWDTRYWCLSWPFLRLSSKDGDAACPELDAGGWGSCVEDSPAAGVHDAPTPLPATSAAPSTVAGVSLDLAGDLGSCCGCLPAAIGSDVLPPLPSVEVEASMSSGRKSTFTLHLGVDCTI